MAIPAILLSGWISFIEILVLNAAMLPTKINHQVADPKKTAVNNVVANAQPHPSDSIPNAVSKAVNPRIVIGFASVRKMLWCRLL